MKTPNNITTTLTAQELEDIAVEKMLKKLKKTSKARKITKSILG